MKQKHIGMTGSRDGFTTAQLNTLLIMFTGIRIDHNTTFHHGDCVGADTDAHKVAVKRGCIIHIHPPLKDDLRAYNAGQIVEEPKTYFARNRDIVDASEYMIAFPNTMTEKSKGGTWYTINYTRKTKTRLIIIWPDGTSTVENVK